MVSNPAKADVHQPTPKSLKALDWAIFSWPTYGMDLYPIWLFICSLPATGNLKTSDAPATARSVKTTDTMLTLPVETTEAIVSVFHKKDATHVLQQEAGKVINGKLTLHRSNGEKQTTVDSKKEVIEVIWEQNNEYQRII